MNFKMCNNCNHIRKLYSYFIFAFIAIFFTKYTLAQDADNSSIINQQIWIDFYPHIYMSEKFEYYGDLGYRTTTDNYSWYRIYTRPSVRYHMSNIFEVHAGIGLFYIQNKTSINRFEITPWQGVKLNWPYFEKIKFNQMLKIEERISFLTNEWKASFDLRLRYKISGKFNVFKVESDTFWFVPFYGELFIPILDSIEELFSNKNRFGVGLGFNESRELRFEVMFNWQSSRSGPREDLYVSDYVYQLKISRLWNFKTLIKF